MNIFTLATSFPPTDEKNRVLNGRIFTIRAGCNTEERILMDAITDSDLLVIKGVISSTSNDDGSLTIETIDGPDYHIIQLNRVLPTKGLYEVYEDPYATVYQSYDISDGSRRRLHGGTIIRQEDAVV